MSGTRHRLDIEKCKIIININDKLLLELESENEYDKYTIKIIFK